MTVRNTDELPVPHESGETGKGRRPAWAPSLGKAVYALTVHRARLLRAARRAGSPARSHRLRRLARRRKADVHELVRAAPEGTVEPRRIDASDIAPRPDRELEHANEIASLAASLRSNRRLRAAANGTLEKSPPAAVAAKLRRLTADLEVEAASLNERLRDIAVLQVVELPPTSS